LKIIYFLRISPGACLIISKLSINYLTIDFEIVRRKEFLWIFILQAIYLHFILLKNYYSICKVINNNEKTVVIKKRNFHLFFNKFYRIFIFMSFILLLNLHLNQLVKLCKEDHIIEYFFNNILKINNISIITFWMVLLIFSIFLIEKICIEFSVQRILKRKCFHILIFLIYLTVLKFMELEFLLFISVVVLYIFLFLEVIRNRVKNNSLINSISEFLINNIDNRDDNKFILTHTFLLSGCFSSFLVQDTKNLTNFDIDINQIKNFDLNKINIEKFIGIVSLGIGDAFVKYFFRLMLIF